EQPRHEAIDPTLTRARQTLVASLLAQPLQASEPSGRVLEPSRRQLRERFGVGEAATPDGRIAMHLAGRIGVRKDVLELAADALAMNTQRLAECGVVGITHGLRDECPVGLRLRQALSLAVVQVLEPV